MEDGGRTGGPDADAMEQKRGSVAGAPRSLGSGRSEADLEPSALGHANASAEQRVAGASLVPAGLANLAGASLVPASLANLGPGALGHAKASAEQRLAEAAVVPASLAKPVAGLRLGLDQLQRQRLERPEGEQQLPRLLRQRLE